MGSEMAIVAITVADMIMIALAVTRSRRTCP